MLGWANRLPAHLVHPGHLATTECPQVLGLVQAQHGFKELVAIGDGATDLEARQPGGADIFIGCALSRCILGQAAVPLHEL